MKIAFFEGCCDFRSQEPIENKTLMKRNEIVKNIHMYVKWSNSLYAGR